MKMKTIFTHLFFAEADNNNPVASKGCPVGGHFLSNCIMEGFVSSRADIHDS
jgi:hypothetical protein